MLTPLFKERQSVDTMSKQKANCVPMALRINVLQHNRFSLVLSYSKYFITTVALKNPDSKNYPNSHSKLTKELNIS